MQSIVIFGLPVPGLNNTTTEIVWCLKPDNVNPADIMGWTLTLPGGIDEGQYLLSVPLAPEGSKFKIREIANPANYFVGTLTPATLTPALPADIPPSYLFTFTCGHIVRMALGELRVLKPGETPGAEEMEDCIIRLNAMLETWATEGFMIHSLTKETRALVAGDADISIGIGGDWNTTRPIKIDSHTFLRDANANDTPVNLLTLAEYNAIVIKSTSNGMPLDIYYDPVYPLGMLYLYPPPASGYTLHLVSEKPFVSFEDEYTAYSFPTGYAECMAYNLTIRLAGPYNKQLSPSTVAIATKSMKTLKGINAASRPIPRDFSNVPCVGGGGGTFDFYSGS